MTETLRPKPVHLPPFSAWLASNIPAVYDNTMSYYDELTSLIAWLEKEVVPNVNSAITLVNQLKDYVENYFKNLDVQEEINKKLDEMTEDGTLQEIIGEYLNATAVWGFDTVADMKNSTNLINGSFAKTLGYHSKNDDGGATYKIRTITNDDVIDEATIIEINDSSNQLIAELIFDKNVTPEQFGAYGDGTHDDTTAFQKALNSGVKVIANKTYSTTSIAISNNELEIRGHIHGTLNINNNAYVHGGEITSDTDDPCVILESKLANGQGKLNSKLEKCNLHPTSSGVGIKLYADSNALFDYMLSDLLIDSCNKAIYIYNKSTWITKGDFNNIFCSSSDYPIFIQNDQSLPAKCGDMTFRNVYAQYYNGKPLNFFRVDSGNAVATLDSCFCYDGIANYYYYVNPESTGTRIYLLGDRKINQLDAKFYNQADLRCIYFTPGYNDSNASPVIKTSLKNELPTSYYGTLQFENFSNTGVGGGRFFGIVGREGQNGGASAINNVFGIGCYKGRIVALHSSDGTVANASSCEVTTPYSGAIYTTSTLPSGTNVQPGATCWCSDIHMAVTYFGGSWYKPDGTALA